MDVVVTESEIGKLCIRLNGNLDETQAIALSDRLLNVCPDPILDTVRIDLSNCPSVCNQGFAALVSFRLSTQIADHTVEISGQDEETDRRMRILRLDRLFKILPPNG